MEVYALKLSKVQNNKILISHKPSLEIKVIFIFQRLGYQFQSLHPDTQLCKLHEDGQ